MYQSISADELAQKLRKENLAILDVREDDEYIGGHIPEVLHIPLNQIPNKLDQLEPATNYYVICHAGGRSARAAEYLAGNNFQVTNVMGGMSAWKGQTVTEE